MRNTTLRARVARTGCSVLALATVAVVGATPASAQSFAGTGAFTVNGGGGASIGTSPNTTTILLNPGQTVIDWSPTDTAIGGGSINFQPSGTTANFVGSGNFAVLNRINPADSTRSVTLNGIIQTLVLGNNASVDGSLYFYTPGGFVIGSTARINVGSLVLSASPITVSGGSFINGTSVTFGQAPNAASAIVTAAGSQINATAGDAYVAMVAPRVQHGGSINVSGSAALVGAEAATINFSPDGLFDIQIVSGTTDANGVSINGGTITGAASAGAADIHRAYLVAVPKNQALTMLLTAGSTLGFDIAGAANAVGNTIVLSAGKDIVDGEILVARSAGSGTGEAGISMTDVRTTSALVSDAVHNNIIDVSATTAMTGNVTVNSDRLARIFTRAGGALTINGNVEVSGARTIAIGQTGTAANAEIWANGGAITINGNVLVTADAIGETDLLGGPGANATGGAATLLANLGGTVRINGTTDVRTNGRGGDNGANGAGGTGRGGSAFVGASDSGSQLIISGAMAISANGTAGVRGESFGGLITVSAANAAAVTITGNVFASATAIGGSGKVGGNATGGDIFVRALTGGDLSLLGSGGVTISTDAVGGDGGDAVNGNGGNAIGGANAQIFADGAGSTVTIAGRVDIGADATGGASQLLAGGNASAGNVSVYAQNGGNVDLAGRLTATADAEAGTGGFVGGTAFNTGDVAIYSLATLGIGGSLYASAQSVGGGVFDNNLQGLVAGNGTGGRVNVYAQNGTLDLDGAVTMVADGIGGGAGGFQDRAGNGTGGESRLLANAGGVVALGSTLSSSAVGYGGQLFNFGAFGGSGQGGAVRLQATAANGRISIVGFATIDASGNASNGGECFSCGNGGNGTGGTAWVDSFGAASASISLMSNITALAQGRGGGSIDGVAGNGQGGQAVLHALNGSTQTIGGNAVINADGFGGTSNASQNGVGGNGTGGNTFIQTDTGASTISIAGSAAISASGQGGESTSISGGRGGNGLGGSARLYATPGTITIGSPRSSGGVVVAANGSGGNSSGGTGGNGVGGNVAEIVATDGGDITIAGLASVSSDGTGGNGVNGGIGDGGGIYDPITATWSGGARVTARGGDIIVNGGVQVSATGEGGDATFIDPRAGNFGGTGGNGFGGNASIHAANSDFGPSSITVVASASAGSGIATLLVDGVGGAGGDGVNGGAGGTGGSGRAGNGSISAAAGNGMVTIDQVQAFARGFGGSGGDGGSNIAGAGGNGGVGGAGNGGSITVGTTSGLPQAVGSNLGFGDYGRILANASGTGGDGGSGSLGTTTSGNGGNGGSADGGGVHLLVRGSRVDVGVATLVADARGGDGGLGAGNVSNDGNGGNATVGSNAGFDFIVGVDILVTGRFQIPAQRGVLNAGVITGSAVAIGGQGAVDGSGLLLGASSVRFLNADGNIGSLEIVVDADRLAPGAFEESISVINGTVAIANAFSFTTTGNLSLFADNGRLTADTVTLDAATFVADRLNVTPGSAGTVFANIFAITTGGNFITTANLDSVAALVINAPGRIEVGNVSADDDIRLTSGGNLSTGAIDSGDDVVLIANGSVSTLDIFAHDDVSIDAAAAITTDDITGNTIDLTANGAIDTGDLRTRSIFGGQLQLEPGASITVRSAGSIRTGSIASRDGVLVESGVSIATGAIDAADFVELDSVGGIRFGNATARSFDFTAGGAVTGGNITAVSFAIGEAGGAILLGNIRTTGPEPANEISIGFASNTSITVGNATANGRIGFGSAGDLTTGNLTANSLILALVGDDIVTGSITTAANGRVYLADSSMVDIGGGIGANFNPAPILALTPVATGGSIAINGGIATGRFQAAAGDDLAARAITATSIEASARGNATIDGLWRSPSVALRSGDIAITANGSIDAGTNGTILLNAVRSDGGALIGDGLTGTGYALSNAEFGRISGGTITIAVGGNGGDADTLIGDLTITGPLAGSNIESSTGGVEFVTLHEDGAAFDGTLRVVGDIVATGFGAENYLGFYTQNFELDTATGSIAITSSGNALAGILEIYASRIHVAEGTVLNQLAVNPQFAGYREALNRPAAVQRPEGVLRAASFELEFGSTVTVGPYTLFVQNLGTTAIPSGFLLNAAEIGDDGGGTLAPGSVDLVINGQIATPTGTLTGVAVRDFLVGEFGTTAFVPGSTINGCPLTGSCNATPIRVDTLLRTDVQLTDNGGFGDGLFGNESDIDDGEDGDEGDLSSPIAATNPLFDSRPLNGTGDVDDPVSGTGNPSLMGTSDDDIENCDTSKDSTCKTGKKGDGK